MITLSLERTARNLFPLNQLLALNCSSFGEIYNRGKLGKDRGQEEPLIATKSTLRRGLRGCADSNYHICVLRFQLLVFVS